MENTYNKGDTVYQGYAQWSGDIRTCPVCDGTAKVLVKPLGAADDAGSILNCEYCINRHEGEPRRGLVIDEWSWHPIVRSIKIEGLEIKDGPDGIEVKYLFNVNRGSHSYVYHTDVVGTYDEAMEKATASALTATDKSQSELPELAPRTNQKRSWHVGYHKKQIKDNKAKLTKLRHELKDTERVLAYAKKELNLLETETPE